MARPKGNEETFPLHTRLSPAQLAGFREYLRRQQEQIKHTGVVLTDAAVLRGMVLRCLEQEGIPHTSQQALTFGPSPAPASPEPAAPAPASVAPPPAAPPPPEPAAPEPAAPAAPAAEPKPKASATKKPAPAKSAPAKGATKSTSSSKSAAKGKAKNGGR